MSDQNVVGQPGQVLIQQLTALVDAGDHFDSELTQIIARDADDAVLAVFIYAKGEAAQQLNVFLELRDEEIAKAEAAHVD